MELQRLWRPTSAGSPGGWQAPRARSSSHGDLTSTAAAVPPAAAGVSATCVRDDKRERRLQDHTEIWRRDLLPNFLPGSPPSRKMERLWRQGLPPRVRETLWPIAIGNVLRITPELYDIHKEQALEARRQLAEASEAAAPRNAMVTLSDQPQRSRAQGRRHERGTALIPFDLPRTFPTLVFFQEGGPMHDDCMRILEAYTFFRPDIGYVQGMTYLAAVLLLYLGPFAAFVGLCNLLNAPTLLGLYRLDQSAVQCRANVFNQLLVVQLPEVARTIDDAGLTPEMFLIEWFMTIYSKVLPIDVASVVWDLFLLDGEVVLYCTACALLRMSATALLEGNGADLEACARILGKDLRRRICDPDELLWHISEVKRRTPQHLLADIAGIAESEFGAGGAARRSLGSRPDAGGLGLTLATLGRSLGLPW